MRAVDAAEVFEVVFAGAVVVVFASAGGAVFGRGSRPRLVVGAALVGSAAAAGWVAFALDPSRELALAAGGLTVCLVLELGTLALRRLAARAQNVEGQLQGAEQRLEALVAKEVETRGAELERTLARARADSLSR